MRYINPLKLYDSKGLAMVTNYVCELRPLGYIFDSFFLTVIESGFELERYHWDKAAEELRKQSYVGVKDDEKVVDFIIPLSCDLVNVKFEYDHDGDDLKETLLFKKGQL